MNSAVDAGDYTSLGSTRRWTSTPTWYPQRPAWMDAAECRGLDPNLFFHEQGDQGMAAARRVCAACPSKAECLEYALENNERFGMWGGRSVQERNAIRRRRKREAL